MSVVVGLTGSLRAGSTSTRALRIAAEGLSKVGLPVEWVELPALQLPLFEEDARYEHEGLAALKAAVRRADGLLIATPVYHDSYSGVLKNAVDHLYDELLDKIVGLIAVGGGRTGQGQALEHLRAVFRETGAWVLPRQVAIGPAEQVYGPGARPLEREIDERLVRLGQELMLRIRQLRPRRTG